MAWHLAITTWLAHAALGGSAVLLVACLVLRLCKQPVRRLRIIELTLLGCLVVPWLSQLPFVPHWSAGVLSTEPERAVETAIEEPTEVVISSPEPLSSRPIAMLPAPKHKPTHQARAPRSGDMTAPSPATEAVAGEAIPDRFTFEWPEPSALVVIAYAAVVALIAGRWLVGVARLRRLLRSARPVPSHIASLFGEVAGARGAGVALLMSDRVSLPLMCGLRRPIILLPSGMCADADSADLRYALAHEWSHIERYDLFRWHFASLVGLLFFWQPLFWWLRRQLRLGQDYLADALAARQADAAEDYASFLVSLARRHAGLPAECALGIGDRRSNLARRVLMLINTREPLQRRCPGLWSLAVAVVAVGLLAGISAIRLDAGDTKTEKDVPKKQVLKGSEGEKSEKLDYTGRVTDKDTGKPIPDAVVTVRRSVYSDPEVKPEDWIIEETKHKTDKDGKYSFTIPAEQASKRYMYIELDVEGPGHAPQKGFGYSLTMIRKNEKLGGRPFFENVTLRAGQEISGSVETPDGKPAAGVKVLAYSVTSKRNQGEFEYGSFADTKTDDKGHFALTVVTPGDCVFWLLPTKYAPSMHLVKDNKRGDQGKFGLQEGMVLRGKAVDAQGKPLAGLYVAAQRDGRDEALANLFVADSIGRCATTNAKGEFELMPLPAGKYSIQPSEHNSEPSRDGHRSEQKRLPAVFLRQMVTLTTEQKPEAIEVRAVPHVVIEAQYYDSKGKTRRGHEPFIFGQIDGQSWFTQAQADANGKVTVMAPHGMENTRLQLSTNEHGALRWRKAKGDTLSRAREIDLGTIDKDIKGIEIIRYDAPILLVKVETKDGTKPKNAAVTALYPEEKGLMQGRFIVKNGLQSDVTFEEQEDGRFRSSQLQPDEEVTITAHAEGYQEGTAKVKIVEGATKDVTIVLEKK